MTTRHYSLIKGFALVVFMPLFAACSNEEDATVPGGEPQEVQVSISTRATADGDTWTWQNGDAINLYVMGYGSTSPTTRTLTYINGASWTTFNVTLPATVEACYPATATLTSFTIPTNQSAGIAEADYMTTASSQQLNGTNLSLALVHRLCKVAVTITDWSDYGNTMPAISDFKITSYPNVTRSEDSVIGTGDVTDVIAYYTEGSTYTAIIAPSSNGFTLKLKVNEMDMTATSNQEVTSGNAYSFDLTVTDKELTLTPASTNVLPGWDDETDLN